MIQLDNVKRQFGTQILFENLSWMIPERARLGLVGPNGVGKTTLLRMLAGLESPDAGTLHGPRDLEVGYLPQEVESIGSGSVLSTVMAGFAKLADAERELEALAARLEGLTPEDPETARLTAQYGELHQRFELLGGHALEARAKVILSGLGIPVARFHESVSLLSGGWRMRVVLARLLLGAPALLLLDEPTNHLDLEATIWLEEFLDSYQGAFLVVSHDRYFLNRMVKTVVELTRGELTHYDGNYDDYLQEKELREARLEKAAKRQAKEIARVERFIERFRYKNTKSRQVQSRVKALSKTERIRTASDAKRIHFGFPPATRSGDIVLKAESLGKRYPAAIPGADDVVVYEDMNLLLRRGDRVALVGPNGTGKSTLMKMLVGDTDVTSGTLTLGHNVNLHYYAQHQLEALDPKLTVLEEVGQVAGPAERPRLRKLLGGFLFGAHDVEKKVAVLSGGEKARVALAKILIQPANLLLMDEPTNHLDLQSSEVLEDALNAYEGTLVVISHDRYFINRVVTAIAEVGGGKITLHEGDYDEFNAWKKRRAADGPAESSLTTLPHAAPDADPAGAERDRKRRAKREAAEERNRQYRERQAAQARLGPIEAEIAALEKKIRDLEARQADPAVYSDAERAREAGRDRTEAEARLAQLYAEWEAAAEDR